MKKFLFFLGCCLCFSGCGKTYQLKLQTLEVVWTLDLKVQMQQISSDTTSYVYQEFNDNNSQSLDSLLVSSLQPSLWFVPYIQQELNGLRLQGYEITQEHTKKSKKLIDWNEYPAILKTYRIVNLVGQPLYIAQYAVQRSTNLILLSYASDEESHRKIFIKSLNSLTFY